MYRSEEIDFVTGLLGSVTPEQWTMVISGYICLVLAAVAARIGLIRLEGASPSQYDANIWGLIVLESLLFAPITIVKWAKLVLWPKLIKEL